MEHIEAELAAIQRLNRSVQVAAADESLRRMLAKLPRHELIREEHRVRQAIEQFLPKRRKALLSVLEAALASRGSQAATRPAGQSRSAAPQSSQPFPPGKDGAGLPTREPGREAVGSSAGAQTDAEGRESLEELIPTIRQFADDDLQKQALVRLASATLKLVDVETKEGEDPLVKLFDAQIPSSQKRMIASCLARCASRIPWLTSIASFRMPTMKLFDDVWHHELYAAIGIATSAQTYDKWNSIETAVRQFEAQLGDLMNGLTSLSMFSAVRQELKQSLNSKIARAIVWPLSERELVTLRLDDVLTLVSDYIGANSSAAFEARTRALDALHDYIARAKDSKSPFVRGPLAGIASRLAAHVDEHFANSPLSKPAVVRIKPSPKKYPLEEVGADCQVGVTVECKGPGHAFDVELEYSVSENLAASGSRQYLGNLQPEQVVEGIVLPCRVLGAGKAALVTGKLRWVNHSLDSVEEPFAFELTGQPSGIDWQSLDTVDPYSLEPVIEERELVGRTEILNQLTAKVTAASVGSFFVFGQKRVGKTSLVRSLQSRLRQIEPKNLLVVYLDGGDYVHPDPLRTIERLGTRICEEIAQADRRFANIPRPVFDGALSPIDSFLRAVLQIAPDYRIVFILDEFDELPVEIYRRGPIGDAFFLTLRSISAKSPFGFVLVGGEKMEFILSTQGDALNKFKAIRVDYFDREKHWSDFQDLVRRPTSKWLEISDDALVALYNASAGNPFFAKLLCDEMFRLVVQRRDAHVTPPEVRETVRRTLASAGSNRFSHFWEDGIFAETGDKVEERSMARRHLLLALADGLRTNGDTSKAQLTKAAAQDHLTEYEIASELTSFERRQVLECVHGNYRCKVGLFGDWLRDRGVQEIVTTFSDKTAILKRRAEEEQQRIPESEMQALAEAWGPYKGRHIGPEAIRSWLAQCGNVAEQRLMFELLKDIRFYTTSQIRAKMHEAHGIVERLLSDLKISHGLEGAQRKRHDIIVSHLGGVAKSGVRYGQLYADENNIISERVVERDRLGLSLAAFDKIAAVVLVDDFIGSGQSAIEAFRDLTEGDKQLLRNPKIAVVYVVVCGFESGRAKLESALEKLDLPVHVHVCDQLTEADRCFSDVSRVFPDSQMRQRAKDLAYSLGRRLVKNAPLGYVDGQALVVFDTNCPNNSLPVLWEERPDWRPLFRRQ